MNYRTRRASRAGAAAVAVLIVTLAGMFVNQVHLGDRADSNEKTANDAVTGLGQANRQIDGLSKSVDEANRRLAAAGKPTVPVPTVTPVTPPQLPDGLTTSQSTEVRSIVITELAQQKITLSSAEVSQISRTAAALVPKPKDGVTPTAAQLQQYAASAVTAYCADGRCVRDGKNGTNGKDAPPVTDEQLFTQAQRALTAYCAQDTHPCQPKDGKDGTNGTNGTDGTNGADGRGITSGPTCLGEGDDSYWLTRYSDGTEQRQDGPCRLQPLLPTTTPSN